MPTWDDKVLANLKAKRVNLQAQIAVMEERSLGIGIGNEDAAESIEETRAHLAEIERHISEMEGPDA